MRKRRKNDRRKRYLVLAVVILCSYMAGSTMVYGFDVSDTESFDTGGFDMDVGEGSGQLPEDWEDTWNGGTGEDHTSSDTEKQEDFDIDQSETGAVPEIGSSGTGGMDENRQDDDTWEWRYEAENNSGSEDTIAGYENRSGNAGDNRNLENSTEPEKISGLPDHTDDVNAGTVSVVTVTPASVQTPTVTALPTPVQTPIVKLSKPSPAPVRPTAAPGSAQTAETETEPAFSGEIHNDQVQIEIRENVPFQILSLRIRGKECDFCWQGKKFLVKAPKKSRKIKKVEILGFSKSGRLYHEIVDLTEKQ